jgi:hypothetical protein
MSTTAKWLYGLLIAGVVLLPLPAWMAWENWRLHKLLAFCKHARVGITIPDLLTLERRDGIDDSYLVQVLFDGYIDQAHSRDLEFRSHIYDPPYACAISHNGAAVASVQLLKADPW